MTTQRRQENSPLAAVTVEPIIPLSVLLNRKVKGTFVVVVIIVCDRFRLQKWIIQRRFI